MIRNLKAMALALVALLAMSAFAAATASAQFESEAETTTLSVSSSGMQKFAPTAGGTDVECTTISLDSSTQTSKKTTTVTIQPTYSNCETFLGAATAVKTNGCKYVFHSAAGSTSGTNDVVCPAGSVIEINVGSICRYTIGSQNNLGTVSFKNTGAGSTREVIVEPKVTGITSTRTTNDFFCPAAGSTGTYTGTSTVTGTSGGAHVGVFVD
jgi:hypothetical protein